MSEQNKLTRRDFIKGAAAVSASVATAGLFANTAQAAPSIPTKWDKETDVVVIGTGIAGLPAAIEAAVGGAEVIVLEKENLPGGASCTAGGHMILGATHILAEEGLKDTPEAWYEDEMKTGDYRAVPEAVRAYSTKGDELVRWFEKLGLVYAVGNRMSASPGHRINRSHWPAPSANYVGAMGLSEINLLLKEVERLKVPVLVKHRMTRLYRDGTGPVVGVEVKNETGTINIKARKGVIIATGAFVDNAQLCKAWDIRIADANPGDGDFYGDMLEYKQQTGDGLLAAQAIGAGLTDMSFVAYVYVRFGTKRYVTWEPPDLKTVAMGGTGINAVGGTNSQWCIMVKKDGSRFVNEALGGQTLKDLVGGYDIDMNVTYERNPFVLAYITLQDYPRNVWAITDAKGAAAAKWPIEAMKVADPKKAPNGLWPDMVAIADTLQELATKMKIPAAALEATITKYNGFVDAGKDADFGKPTPLNKIATPPFYAARAAGLRHTQRNGLRINSKTQVLELSDNWDGLVAKSVDQEKVIPHLYAVGECSNVLGWRRPHGTMGIYAILGRFAGQNAAKETPLPST